jgi:hypothetical protein
MEEADRSASSAALRRRAVPAIPFVFSLALSLTTVGSNVFWQDSGFYLSAIHDLAVPASHGFVLYLFLAKAWTIVVAPLAGFTLSVHLFSAFCAAGAAAFLADAARAFLKRMWPEGPSDGPAIAAAMVTAGGYAFWNSSTLAKPYALYYLTLSILLWLMVRAEKKRDFLAMGAVLGLAGAAHPSAGMLIPAMVVYAAARRDKIRELGVAGCAAVVGLAAATAFVPSFIGLPMLAARESVLSMGDPRTPGQVWSHLRGANYTDFKGAWGFDLARAVLAGKFIWEEFLGVGLAVLGIGLWRLGKERPRALALLGAWAGPMLFLPLVFVGEGMFDQWFVAAYLPLAFCTAAGFAWVAAKARVLFPAALATAVAWMILANFGDLNFRNYDLARTYGRLLLKNLEEGAIFVATTDDTAVIPMYLQRVEGERKDVRLVHGEFVGVEWYDRRIERDLGVKKAQLQEIADRTIPALLTVTAIANANVAPGKPVYSERPPDVNTLRPGLVQVPAGMLWKIAVEAEGTVDLRHWNLPVEPFAISRARRRARGIFMRHTSKGMVAQYEPYENRLIGLLVQAALRRMPPPSAETAAGMSAFYEKLRSVDPSLEVDGAFQYNYGLTLYLVNRMAPAKTVFENVLSLEPGPARATLSHFYLAEIARSMRNPEAAKKHYARALEINGAEPVMMKNIRIRAEQP